MRRVAICLVIVLALGCGAIAAGLRVNGSRSFPVGLYLAVGKSAQRGDLVFVSIPPLQVLAMARERGYLNVAYCNVSHLLKRLAGVPGDRVTIDESSVEVNGVRLANSSPLPSDGAGRPLKAFPLKDRILAPGEVLLMSDYNPASGMPDISVHSKRQESNRSLHRC
jgi:conjugative transfer signal peptidase TraF